MKNKNDQEGQAMSHREALSSAVLEAASDYCDAVASLKDDSLKRLRVVFQKGDFRIIINGSIG